MADENEVPPVVRQFYADSFVWIDLELTGLDLEKDVIVEIAVILTDKRLLRTLKGPNLVIKTDPQQLSPWCVEAFAKNGLLEDMQKAHLSMKEAEEEVMRFLHKYVPNEKRALLAGSSVHVDRQFLLKCMPRITEYLHYRIIDVSTVRTLGHAWRHDIMTTEQFHNPLWVPSTFTELIEEKDEEKCSDENTTQTKSIDQLPGAEAGAKSSDSAESAVTSDADDLPDADDQPDADKQPKATNEGPPAKSVAQVKTSDATETDPSLHRAMADIERSIAALRFCQMHLFKSRRAPTIAAPPQRDEGKPNRPAKKKKKTRKPWQR